jgi:ribosomal protein S18 acetylase RimI-like enzyme
VACEGRVLNGHAGLEQAPVSIGGAGALVIRNLQPGDAAVLSVFFMENDREDVRRHFHPFPLATETAKSICMDRSGDQYFAHFDDTRILGFGMLRGWKEGFSIPSFGLLVDHRAAGRGIGTSLTAHAVQRAQDLGCPAVRLTVHSDNQTAIRLYARTGFRPSETLDDGRIVMRIDFR